MMAVVEHPLFWAALTIAAFVVGQQLYQRLGQPAFLPPIFTAIALLLVTLTATDTPYSRYMQGGDFLHQLLGPLIVMLAVPLYQQLPGLKRHWLRVILAVSLGSATTVACAALMTHWLLADSSLTLTMLSKSITTPVAVAVTEQLGGDPSLASGFVILTGILAAMMVVPLLTLLRLSQPETVGITLGSCGHAIGTGRAIELGPVTSAYAALAMTLTATLHAVVLPWLMG